MKRGCRDSGGLRGLRAGLLASLVAGGVAGVGNGAAWAGPADELHVAVHAPIGKGCISGEKLKVAVQKRVGGGGQRKTVDVRIQTNEPEPGWVAEVAVTGREGSRTVRTQSASCNELDDGLVLVVILLVDPEEEPAAPETEDKGKTEAGKGGGSWGTDAGESVGKGETKSADGAGDAPKGGPGEGEPGASNRAGVDGGVGKEAVGKEAVGKEAVAKGGAVDRNEERNRKVQFSLGSSFVYTLGLMPSALPGWRWTFSWRSPAPFPIETSFTLNARWAERRSDSTVSLTRQVDSMSFEAAACPLGAEIGRLGLAACGGMALTYVEHNFWGSDPGAQDPDQSYIHQEHVMISPVAELRLGVRVLPWLRAKAGFGGMLSVNPISADSYTQPYSDRELTGPVIFRGQLGIEAVLPP